MSTYLISDIPQGYYTFHHIISRIDNSRIWVIKQKQKVSGTLALLLDISLRIFVVSIGFIGLSILLKILLWFFIPKLRFDNLNTDLDKDKYLKLRNLYDTIGKDLKVLTEGKSFFQKMKIPFILKGLIGDLTKIIDSILIAHDKIDHILKSMNFPANITTSPFVAATEDEIWKNRNKAYQYLM